MATNTSKTQSIGSQMAHLVSGLVPIADTYEVSDLHDKATAYPHCFIGVQFFKADGTTVAVPTAGTLTVKAKTINNGGIWEDPTVSSIDATAPVTIDFAGNAIGVQLIPNALAGDDVISYVVTLTRNAT